MDEQGDKQQEGEVKDVGWGQWAQLASKSRKFVLVLSMALQVHGCHFELLHGEWPTRSIRI